jgi:hypothetical protein
VDYSQAMIDFHWQGPKEKVHCANWLSFKLPPDSQDIVLCDGGLQTLSYPQEQKKLISTLRSVLSDQGLCVFRLFTLPTLPDTPEAVLEDLLSGRIINCNIFKIRLSMALQRNPEEGVVLGDVYKRAREAVPDFEKLASKIGWTTEHMMTINNYRELDCRFNYLTVDQTVDLFCREPGGFSVGRIQYPSYEPLGRCPTLSVHCCPQE